jgi:type I restriction enzyme R subunit
MTVEISERAFEDAIECVLLAHGPDACPGDATLVREPTPAYGEDVPGGYRRRSSLDYDAGLCLIPADVLNFILATQPREWEKLEQHHGADLQDRLLKRLSREIGRRGALDVLRNGIKDSGCKFQLAYFRPASGLNEELQRLHAANLFAVLRQLHYRPNDRPSKPEDKQSGPSVDLGLFLNGIPIFTAELKNPLTGQNVQDAIKQYKEKRDPRDPLFAYGRCLAHFAVDPDLVYVTTALRREKTLFLPFNQGKFGGAGNPPVPPTQAGYATRYLWERTWARDSVLDLIRQFIHEVEEEDDKGRKTGERFIIFPRYQQLEAVRELVADARRRGPGQRYLIQHSAGSGKSFTIAWLAHQLSTLFGPDDRRVFDSIVVITDRRILDRQLQRSVRQFEQTLGVVENIDTTSRQLKEAVASGKTIIVTTLQKFPAMLEQIREMARKEASQGKAPGASQEVPGHQFAVIVDEAHSSQAGDSPEAIKRVFTAESLEAAARADLGEEEDDGQRLWTEAAEGRRFPPNMSFFAFTATPKEKTLELFGRKNEATGEFEPFHLYRMCQAIEEGFILDVLESYTTYQSYWRLLKTALDDPHYDKQKAAYLMRCFVELHPHAIKEKVRIMVDHFATQVQSQISGKAKAMIVTRSRLHAVRYKREVDRYLAEQGHPWKALVAFSGTVKDEGAEYTEPRMNSEGKPQPIGERQTAREFEKADYRFLIVANKFQTGFDQPLLHTMYVDKKLSGIHAIQALSRLNRTHPPDKTGTMVLDFENDAETIQKAFEGYTDITLLSEGTDPDQLYDAQSRLLDFHIYTENEVETFAGFYFDPKTTQDQIYAALYPMKERFGELPEDEQEEFRRQLTKYVRLYAFLSQVLTFSDADLEKLYAFARHLRRVLPGEKTELPREVQQNIDMESYRIQQTGSGKIAVEKKAGRLEPMSAKEHRRSHEEQLEPLSLIIAELNERFGLNLGPEHRVTVDQMMGKLDEDDALDASARVNTRENVRLTFDKKVEHVIQEIVDSNFSLYKRITDDQAFGQVFKNYLFDHYLRTHRQADELLKQQESKTLEFKSTLRWNLREKKKDPKIVTHAVLKTVAAFLNTEGGDLLIGVADDRSIVGIGPDAFESEDKFMLHLSHVVQSALGDRAGTCIDPKMQVVQSKAICLVSCQRSPEPVFLKWQGTEGHADGDFFVRSGPGTVKLEPDSAKEYIRTRFQAS